LHLVIEDRLDEKPTFRVEAVVPESVPNLRPLVTGALKARLANQLVILVHQIVVPRLRGELGTGFVVGGNGAINTEAELAGAVSRE
jgi:hypothetical protein